MSKIRLDRLKPLKRLQKAEYEKKLEALQFRMLSIQEAYYHAGRRAIVLFEGWDAAGKGGCIRRLVAKLDPRATQVWHTGAPSSEEQARHYLYRFWQKLPEPGTQVVFDRSWYGRVLVERVDALTPKARWKEAYSEINDFERMLVDDGVPLVKIFLHISADEQLRRFAERLADPYKRGKLGPADVHNHQCREDYVEAAHDMFDTTSTKRAPWTVIFSDHKWASRIAALTEITDRLAEGIDISPPLIDEELKRYIANYLQTERARNRKKGK